MKRLAYNKLIEWKNKVDRKPLIINGARQVGKTWILKEFGANEYSSVAYINCDEIDAMKNAFSDFNIDRLIRTFSVLSGVTIKPQETLIILDEIQQVPIAITSLKYFCENAPEYHIAVAGSLLGIGLHEGTGFPVGKVDEINLYPLSFKEFLFAMGNDILVKNMEEHRWDELSSFSNMFIELLRQYYYVGGMPEVVKSYIEHKDVFEVRNIQKQILADYRRDFSKHVPAALLPKVNMVWDCIPSQLAKENKKFIYGVVREGGRAKDFETAIMWLCDCGLVHKVSRITTPNLPLKAYEDLKAFKLFLLDVGLLGCMSGISKSVLLDGNDMFKEFKGALTEQYVAQELTASGNILYYYSSESSSGEVDFLLQKEGKYIPLEVKAEENLKSQSLKAFCKKYSPDISIRSSMSDYREQAWMVNVPLYMISDYINTL